VRGDRKGLQPQLRGVECKIPFLFFMFRRTYKLWLKKYPRNRGILFYIKNIKKHKIGFVYGNDPLSASDDSSSTEPLGKYIEKVFRPPSEYHLAEPPSSSSEESSWLTSEYSLTSSDFDNCQGNNVLRQKQATYGGIIVSSVVVTRTIIGARYFVGWLFTFTVVSI
jgi:hypothetical protein